MHAFDGRPFAAGTMVGIRSFAVDGLGRLTGVTQPEVFTPSENTAACRRVPINEIMQSFTLTFTGAPSSRTLAPVRDDHRAGKLGCSCGYYAYFDAGDNPNHRASNVEAIIEGYGIVTTGTRGFRAEKARLVGLIAPGNARRVSQVSLRRALQALSVVLIVAGIATVIAVSSGPLSWAGVGANGVGWLGLVLLANWEPPRESADAPAALFEQVCHNYPDVPVYQNRAAALRAHPLTVPPIPTPESDPEFWTRAS